VYVRDMKRVTNALVTLTPTRPDPTRPDPKYFLWSPKPKIGTFGDAPQRDGLGLDAR
jgi:hypothetical protein